MRLFAPHLRRSLRGGDDFRALRHAGVAAVVEPARWPGRPPLAGDDVEDQAATLLGWERFRASLFGVRHYAALCLDPREDAELGLGRLHRYLGLEGVVAVGEIGVEELAPVEERRLLAQLDLARRHRLPVWLRAPSGGPRQLVDRMLAVVRDAAFPASRVLIGNLDDETVPIVLDENAWASCPLAFDTPEESRRALALLERYGEEQLILDGGVGELLGAPRLAARLRDHGLTDARIEGLYWQNPIRFFGESGRLHLIDGTPPLRASEPLDEPATYFGAVAGPVASPMLR
jgi:predicted metal-dependent TIM-barrel fold hydrolase